MTTAVKSFDIPPLDAYLSAEQGGQELLLIIEMRKMGATRPDQLDDAPAWRVPAYDLEQIICDQLSALLTEQRFVCDMVSDATAETVRQALASADLSAATLRSGTARDKALLLLPKLVSRIDLQEEGIDLAIDRAGLVEVLGMGVIAPTPTGTLVLTLPATKVRRWHQLRLIIPDRRSSILPPSRAMRSWSR